jgi:hypothetical protein
MINMAAMNRTCQMLASHQDAVTVGFPLHNLGECYTRVLQVT